MEMETDIRYIRLLALGIQMLNEKTEGGDKWAKDELARLHAGNSIEVLHKAMAITAKSNRAKAAEDRNGACNELEKLCEFVHNQASSSRRAKAALVNFPHTARVEIEKAILLARPKF